ncbi:MAG: tail sheath stabilizer and completion protein [Candidatus Nanopelagicaceae bacterium]
MFEYFYFEIFRKVVIGFGTLFNNIELRKTNSEGAVTSVVKVPIAYGPKQKFLARINEAPKDLNNPVQITLPRMSFEFNGLSYDQDRKLTTTEYFTVKDKNDPKSVIKTFIPVPYNMSFELNIMTKINDDALQIIEQILPYFQPAYTLTIDLQKEIGEKRDIPFQIEGISMQDDYEGNFETRRALIYTIKFTAKTYLFGPTKKITDGIIRKSTIGFVAGTTSGNPDESIRDKTYSVTPTATKSYSDTAVAYLTKDVLRSDTVLNLNTVSDISVGSIITIDSESLKVTYIDSNKNTVTVVRGSYKTKATDHVSGTGVEKVVPADNDLIQPGDDFGFDGRLF